MSQVFSNNATSLLTTPLAMSTTSMGITTGDGAKFQSPTGGDYELVTLHDKNYTKYEVVMVTARSSDTFTIVRGVEGTQQTWNVGDFISANVTAKTLSDLTSVAEGADSTATSAQADATDALNQLDNLVVSVENPAVTATFRVVTAHADGADTIQRWRTILDDSDGLQYLGVNTGIDSGRPLPNLGFEFDDWAQVQVHRNGVPVSVIMSAMHDQIEDANENMFQIMGHRYFRVKPDLQVNEVLTITAPRGYWYDTTPNSDIGKGYDDLYSDTGVIHSFIMGGYLSSVHQDTVQMFDWSTHFVSLLSSSFDIYTSGKDGMGGATDKTEYAYCFGGGTSGSNRTSRLKFNPLTSTSDYILSAGSTRYGTTFTDALNAFLCGYGTSTTNKDIWNFDLTTRAMADTGQNVVGSTFQYPCSFTSIDNATGHVFNFMNDVGSVTYAQHEYFAIATEVMTVEDMTVGFSYDSTCCAIYENGRSYIWTTYTGSGDLFQYNTATNTIALSLNNFYTPSVTSPVDCISDGKHYTLTSYGALLCGATEAVSMERQRMQSSETGYLGYYERPVGSATDYWSNS